MLCNPCVIYYSGVTSQHLQRTARLVGAVIVAVVTVHVPLPQLSACLVLLTAAAVAVAVVGLRRRPLAVLLVVAVVLVVAVSVLPGAAVGLPVLPVGESLSSLGIVQGREVVVVVGAADVALWHHLQVGPDAVVAGTCDIAEVDDAALVGALIGRLDPGEAEFMGDVASYDLNNLAKADKTEREERNSFKKVDFPIFLKHSLEFVIKSISSTWSTCQQPWPTNALLALSFSFFNVFFPPFLHNVLQSLPAFLPICLSAHLCQPVPHSPCPLLYM